MSQITINQSNFASKFLETPFESSICNSPIFPTPHFLTILLPHFPLPVPTVRKYLRDGLYKDAHACHLCCVLGMGIHSTLTALAVLVYGSSAEMSGCYNSDGTHRCDCESTEDKCDAAKGTWTAGCRCESVNIDIGCSWTKPDPAGGRFACAGFPESIDAKVGDILEISMSGSDIAQLTSEADYDSCSLV
jgi:hypothetical protein